MNEQSDPIAVEQAGKDLAAQAKAVQVVTLAAEIEGQRYDMLRRITDGASTYSFDGGQTWEATAHGAFVSAKKAGQLKAIGQPASAQAALEDEAAGTILELAAQIRALRPGEKLTIAHAGTAIQVLAERVVLTFRPSALEGVGVEPAQREEA
jgi:hypothetical protein